MAVKRQPKSTDKYLTMKEHRHWAAFEMQNEGRCFNVLHEAVSNGTWDGDAERQLINHASVMGECDADSILSGDPTPVELERYRSYQDGPYMGAIRWSINIIRNIPATGALAGALTSLERAMDRAYTEGRKAREREAAQSKAKPNTNLNPFDTGD